MTFTQSGTFDESGFRYNHHQSGKASSSPFAAILPREVLEDTFDVNVHASGDLKTQKFEFSETGKINGHKFEQKLFGEVLEILASRRKSMVKMEFERQVEFSENINEFWRKSGMPAGESVFAVTVIGRNDCMHSAMGPLDKKCTATVVITGKNNGEDIGYNIYQYQVLPKKVHFVFTHDDTQQLYVSLEGIDSYELMSIRFQCGANKSQLLVQIVGPAGVNKVYAAVGQFASPFMQFFSEFESADDAARAFVYSDKIMNAIQGKGYFNLYPIFESTMLESEVFAKMIHVESVQGAAEEVLVGVNGMIEGIAASVAADVTDARNYVREIVSGEGEAKFDAWFNNI